MARVKPKILDYAVEVDHGGRLTIPGGTHIDPPEGWTADHLLLAALVRCSIASLVYHARRAGHAVSAAGSARATVTRRESDGRYALAEADVEIDARIEPRVEMPSVLFEKAERDCFIGASLTISPRYAWHAS